MGKSLENYGHYSDTNRISAWGRVAFPVGLGNMPFGVMIEGEAVSITSQPVLVYDRRISKIEKEIGELREMLTSMIQSTESEAPIIDLRDISVDQAKEEIARYFRENDGKEIGYEELIDGIGIEPRIVVMACNELEEEGKIG